MWVKDSKGIENLQVLPLEESTDGILWEEANEARVALIDKLSGLDDKLAEDVITHESLENVTASALSAALRRATISCVCIICTLNFLTQL